MFGFGRRKKEKPVKQVVNIKETVVVQNQDKDNQPDILNVKVTEFIAMFGLLTAFYYTIRHIAINAIFARTYHIDIKNYLRDDSSWFSVTITIMLFVALVMLFVQINYAATKPRIIYGVNFLIAVIMALAIISVFSMVFTLWVFNVESKRYLILIPVLMLLICIVIIQTAVYYHKINNANSLSQNIIYNAIKQIVQIYKYITRNYILLFAIAIFYIMLIYVEADYLGSQSKYASINVPLSYIIQNEDQENQNEKKEYLQNKDGTFKMAIVYTTENYYYVEPVYKEDNKNYIDISQYLILDKTGYLVKTSGIKADVKQVQY